jgi:hypothetical protein
MQGNRDARLVWLGAVFLIVGFLAHYFAARAIGGTYIAFRDHLLGFVVLTIVSAIIVGLIGYRFWKGRSDISLLIVGVIQAAIGAYVYINRFSVHG